MTKNAKFGENILGFIARFINRNISEVITLENILSCSLCVVSMKVVIAHLIIIILYILYYSNVGYISRIELVEF